MSDRSHPGLRRAASRRSGSALVELAMLAPWLFFLLIGALDTGFYAHALICTQNAARVAALYTSSSDATKADAATACIYALKELQSNANVGASLATCGAVATDAAPVAVTAQGVSGADGLESQVTVSYRTIRLIPIPGVLPDTLTITRTVVMRVRG